IFPSLPRAITYLTHPALRQRGDLEIGRILHLKLSQIRNPKCQSGLAPRLVTQSNRNFQISDLRCRIRPISKCLSLIDESSMLVPSRGGVDATSEKMARSILCAKRKRDSAQHQIMERPGWSL